MNRLWASLFCLALVLGALAHLAAVAGHPIGDPASVATLASPLAGHGAVHAPAGPATDRAGGAGEADDGADGCTIDAVLSPALLTTPASVRRLDNWRQTPASPKPNAPSPEPPPPIALS